MLGFDIWVKSFDIVLSIVLCYTNCDGYVSCFHILNLN